MEKKMENDMETTMLCRGYIGVIYGMMRQPQTWSEAGFFFAGWSGWTWPPTMGRGGGGSPRDEQTGLQKGAWGCFTGSERPEAGSPRRILLQHL